MTLKELAKIAGVSPSTVSLVLNNRAGVGDAKRREILDLLEKYNFNIPKKSGFDKNLMFLKYIRHGMIVEENAGFISTIMDSIEAECRNEGYNLSIIISENCLENTLQNIDFTKFSGLFVLGTELDATSYPLLSKIPIPYIVIDNIMPDFNCNAISMSNEEMVHQALCHLASMGHKSIGYLKSSAKSQNFDERAFSFRNTALELGLDFDEAHEFLLEPTLLHSYHDMKEYLEKGVSLPNCFFADNDTIAIGAIKALKEYKYKIPENVSVMGFDDIHFAEINSPSLSTMSVPKKLIGFTALKHLHMAIENKDFCNVKTKIGGEIIVRLSTQPCST